MKNCFFVFLLILFATSYSCISRKQVLITNKIEAISEFREKYKVFKIDSVNNVYVIYARKDAVLCKIVSLKDSCACSNVKVGNEYTFSLMSRVPKEFKWIDVSPNAIPHVSGINYYGTWIAFERDSINDIFISFNLKGLCVQ